MRIFAFIFALVLCVFNPAMADTPKFTVTTTNLAAGTEFSFIMSAAGLFTVDWGDGSTETIDRTNGNTNGQTFHHNFTNAGVYTISFDGTATGYTLDDNPVISFDTPSREFIAGISGSLGALFPTIGNGTQNGQQPRFYGTFLGCSNLSGTIPANLFNGVHGQPVSSMFMYTFNNSGFTGAIPSGLFSGISGAPAESMFEGTFMRTNITSIPAGLFSGISGAPAEHMFANTFRECYNLTGSIPSGLFGNISGAPAEGMFIGTFNNCNLLSGTIPDGLFGNITGTPAQGMFMNTFESCSNLTGNVPSSMYSGLTDTDTPPTQIMGNVFAGSGLSTTCPNNLMKFNTGWESVWNNKAACKTPKFTVTVQIPSASDTDFFFNISAMGEFAVDWGDGAIEDILKPNNVINIARMHSYPDAGTYTIRFDGTATGYSEGDATTEPESTISFNGNQKISGISGSLGALFPTIGTGTQTGQQPRFDGTFMECRNLTGTIPTGLFNGVHGRPVSNMFRSTFANTGLTGAIPANLFSGISGAPAQMMFASTFAQCGGLTGAIPANLFSGISGAPARNMFDNTFGGCSNLSGSIPAGLFSGISGAPAQMMFASTFGGCRNLSGSIPAGLFSGISGAPAQMMFMYTFTNSGFTGAIPSGLFSGISGAPAESMFEGTFMSTNITSIPAGLFSGISGAPAQMMFASTFAECGGLTGAIPANLFSGISGAPARNMFDNTFSGCSNLSGSIPAGLFSGISGAPAEYMFANTFNRCGGLTGTIPANLFGNLSGQPAIGMFQGVFENCFNLTGYVPRSMYNNINGGGDFASTAFNGAFNNSGLYTTCAAGVPQVTTGWESYWGGKIVCECTEYNNSCYELCPFMASMPMGNGKTFPIFASRVTDLSMQIRGNNNQVCYVPVETGAGTTGDMTVIKNGTTYHIGTM